MSNPHVARTEGKGRTRKLPSPRTLLVTMVMAGALVLLAGTVAACTVFKGAATITDQGGSGDSYKVAGDPGVTYSTVMDRCEEGSDQTAPPVANDDSDPEDIVVEVEPYGDDGDEDGCNTDLGYHRLDDDTDYYVNVYKGDAYHDEDNDGVYEDEYPDDNEERLEDCMGDGSKSDVLNKTVETANGGTFDSGNDHDGNGVEDVKITIDSAPSSSSDHASAICVSDKDGGESAPQIPLVVK